MAARTLPTLAGCGQPATIRIEIYSAADGRLHGSLDGSVYACEQHAMEMASAVYAAGLTAHRMDGGEVKRCGDGIDFTGTTPRVLTAPTPTEATAAAQVHPRWCDRQDCQRRAEHRSPTVHLDTNRPEATILDVALIQSLHPLAEPMVSLTSIEGPAAEHLLMSIGQARVLTYKVRQLIDATKGGTR